MFEPGFMGKGLDIMDILRGAGATFLARHIGKDGPAAVESMKRAIANKGFSLVHMPYPCPTNFGSTNLGTRNPVTEGYICAKVRRYPEHMYGPARILQLDRGTLAPGAPGDVTIFSTDCAWTYDVNQSFSKSRNTPFAGKRFRGGPMATVVNGAVVWKRAT